MTIDEAVSWLKDSIKGDGYQCPKEVYEMAIEALEAQTPKLTTVRDRYNPNLCHLYCPTCGIWVGMYNKRTNMYNMHNKANGEMCAKCGQALDLSEPPYGGEQDGIKIR